MKLYSVFDEQFNLFSEPFLAADDVAAKRLMVQTATISAEFNQRLALYSLYVLADFDPRLLDPLDLKGYPVVVASSDELVALVEKSQHLMRSNSKKTEDSVHEQVL